MPKHQEIEADKIDAQLCNLEGRAEAAGLGKLADLIAAARSEARRNMTEQQRKVAPY